MAQHSVIGRILEFYDVIHHVIRHRLQLNLQALALYSVTSSDVLLSDISNAEGLK